MANRVQLRRDYALNWTSANPILDQGEPGIEVCSGRMKVGNGTSPWSCLGYMSPGSQGSQGYQGVPGAGFQGPQGNQGFDGPQGNQGAQGRGYQGVEGQRGYTGAQGFQGFQGDPGCSGCHGSQGVQGHQGYQGSQGNQGFQGIPGCGSQGGQGHQGSQGCRGYQGFQGNQGVQGPNGNLVGPVYILVGSTINETATITLTPGQYQLILDFRVSINDPGDYNFNATQSATMTGSGINATVDTIINFVRSGGSGFGRNIFGTDVGATSGIVVASNTTVTLTVNAPSLGNANAVLQGSLLTVIKN